MNDLTSNELFDFLSWIPNDSTLYTRLAEHPGASGRIWLTMLLLLAGPDTPRCVLHEARQLRELFLVTHPLVVRLVDDGRVGITGNYSITGARIVNALEALVRNDPQVMSVIVALLPTWTGDDNTLLATARGIAAPTTSRAETS